MAPFVAAGFWDMFGALAKQMCKPKVTVAESSQSAC